MAVMRSIALLFVLCASCGDACGSDPPAPAPPGLRPPAPPGLRPPAPPGLRPLRCGDYFAVDEIKALGLDPSRFNPDEVEGDPVLGVRCDLGKKMSATLFSATLFSPMVADLHTAVAQGQIQSHPGPTIGSETHWTSMGELHGMLFLSSSKRFAVSLAGRDQGLIERVAQRLDAKLK
jgi:hypothetical protein